MNIITDFFEGPLDLLLKIIEKDNENIYSVNLCSIIDQYMDMISQDSLTLSKISEFVMMAAHLLEIKSRMLLPPEDDVEEADPAMELRNQLAELQAFKLIAQEFKALYESNFGTFTRENTIEQLLGKNKFSFNAVSKMLNGFTLDDLALIYRYLSAKKEDRDKSRGKRRVAVTKDKYQFDEIVEMVSGYITERKECNFAELPFVRSGKEGKIAAFQAILSLAGQGKVKVWQLGEDIHIKKCKD